MNTITNREERPSTTGNDFDNEITPVAVIAEISDETSVDENVEGQTGNETEENENFENDRIKVTKLYEQRDEEMDKLIAAAKKDVGISEKGVRKAIKGVDGVVNILYSDRHDLSQEQQDAKNAIRKIEKEIDNSEYDMLRVPEGEPLDMNKPKEDIDKYTAELEGAVEMSDNAREEFVDTFIEKNIKGIKEKFSKSFREAGNWENAKDIISYKIEREVGFASKEFLKTGKNADFGFEAFLEFSSYRAEERGIMKDKKFITGYVMKIGGYERVIRAYDKPQGSSFVLESTRKQIDNVRRSGGSVVKKEADL